jgi:hypothetical protein
MFINRVFVLVVQIAQNFVKCVVAQLRFLHVSVSDHVLKRLCNRFVHCFLLVVVGAVTESVWRTQVKATLMAARLQLSNPRIKPVLKIEVAERRHVLGVNGTRTHAAAGVVPALEAIVMEIAVVAITGFQYSGSRLMNFDGLVTELARFGDGLVEVGATGGASTDAVMKEVAIAVFV